MQIKQYQRFEAIVKNVSKELATSYSSSLRTFFPPHLRKILPATGRNDEEYSAPHALTRPHQDEQYQRSTLRQYLSAML
ncbi:MAG: hypothetical protein ACOCUY_03915, partial [Verrucomicrobiota bacterium]